MTSSITYCETRNPVPFVDDLLGQTTIYEEQKGNFFDARTEVERQLSSAQAQGTEGDARLGNLYATCGIVHFMQGNAGAALEAFKTAQDHCASDINIRIRALSYYRQAHWQRYCFFPNKGAPPPTEDLEAKSNFREESTTILREIAQLRPSVTDSRLRTELRVLGTQRSCWIIQQVGNNLRGGEFTAQYDSWTSGKSSITDPSLLGPCNLLVGGAIFPKDKDAAFKALHKAHEVYSEINDEAGLATCHMKQGDWLVTSAGPPEAWNTLIKEGTEGYELPLEMERWDFDGDVTRIRAATTCYENADKSYQKLNCPRGQASIKLRWAYLETLKPVKTMDEAHGRYRKAEILLKEAVQLYKDSEDWLGYYTATAHLSLCRIGSDGLKSQDFEVVAALGKWGLADGSYSFALGIGILYCRIGRKWLRHQADYERSLACLHMAAEVFKALGASISSTRVIVDQLGVYRLLGDYSAFDVLAQKGLQLCDSIVGENPAFERSSKNQKRAILQRMFQVAGERGHPDEIHRIAELIEAMEEQLGIYSQLPLLLQSVLNTGVVSPKQQMANVRKEAINIAARQAKFLEPLFRGRQAAKEGDLEEASVQFAKARAVACSNEGFTEEFMNSMVLAYESTSDESNRETTAIFENYLKKMNMQSRQPGILRAFMDERLQQTEKQALLFFCRIKDFNKAESHLQILNQNWRQEWWETSNKPWEYLVLIAETQEGNDRLEEALETYESSMNKFEQLRNRLTDDQLKIALSSQSLAQGAYLQAARVALKMYRTAKDSEDKKSVTKWLCKAFEVSERGKARSLLDLMSAGAVYQTGDLTHDDNLMKWRQLRAWLATRQSLLSEEYKSGKNTDPSRVKDLEEQIKLAETEMQEVEQNLSMGSNDRPRSGAIISLNDLVSCLPKGTAVLQYIFAKEEMIAWAVTNEGMMLPHLQKHSKNEYVAPIRDFYNSCDRGNSIYEQKGKWLAEHLLVPLERILDENSKLIIVPHGPGHLLPYHALPWRGQPLIASHVVTYSPSASVIPLMLNRTSSTFIPKVLAIGNPSEMRYTQGILGEKNELEKPLPATEHEVEYIAKLIPDSKHLIGSDATLSAVLTQVSDYSVLHLATHCRLMPRVPLLSAILLADGDLLTVYHLAGNRTDIPLVVLSGCQTGRGDATDGDDVVGLTRALLAAGVHGAVVSLWPVLDGATSVLMGKFYRCLKDPGLSPAQALQAAQNFVRGLRGTKLKDEVRAADELVRGVLLPGKRHRASTASVESYAHPRYWASFFLVGV